MTAYVIDLPESARGEELLVCDFCATNHTLVLHGTAIEVTFDGYHQCACCGTTLTASPLTTEEASKRLLAMYDSGIKEVTTTQPKEAS
jgi:hypothetical protein